jgi:thioredoxin-like negative regulator of GroEL
MVDVLDKQAKALFGDQAIYGGNQADSAREQLIAMLLDSGDLEAARAEWLRLSPPHKPQSAWDHDTMREQLEIRLASKTGALDALLARYRSQPELAPDENTLRNAALQLRRGGDENGARSVLEFLYDREIRNGHLAAANFLGLAEVGLERGDSTAALALLNRMALVSEEGFDSLPRAAGLLAQYGKTAEAADFVRRRIKAVPWDSDAQLQLARNLPGASPERTSILAAVISDSLAPYRLRAEAARIAGPNSGAAPGSELALLSSAAVTPEAASKPYQVEARIDAAHRISSPEVQLRLWREALAIAPADERLRLGALRAAIGLRRDSLTLALTRTGREQAPEFSSGALESPQPFYGGFRLSPDVLPGNPLSDDERASIAEAISAAAERLDDLPAAQDYLRTAIRLRPEAQRPALQRKLDALTAEQQRRSQNAQRQPAIKNVIEQDHAVRPMIGATR